MVQIASVEQAKQQMQAPQVSHITPMMQQYLDIKAQHADYLLFYRMGDFYELFFDDAVTAAAQLDIALTRRGKHQENDIPMCGVPWHSYEPYLYKLIKAGFKVAVCEQMESPEEAKKRGYKAVVKREVVRIITPGTLIEESLLEARQSNYLACLACVSNQYALAWIDISTGEFKAAMTSKQTLSADLAGLNPSEMVLSDALVRDVSVAEGIKEFSKNLTIQVNSLFQQDKAENKLKAVFQVATLDSFGAMNPAQIVACGALLEYVSITQKGQLPRLVYPSILTNNQFMLIDAATRRNLEIQTTLSGEKKGSLLDVIDYTLTSSGSRLLRNYVALPLTSPEAIHARLDMVSVAVDHTQLRQLIREYLRQIPDIERSLSRICMDKGGPLDLLAIGRGLDQAAVIAACIRQAGIALPKQLETTLHYLGRHRELVSELLRAIKEEPPRLARDGHFIAEAYHPRLDELRLLSSNSKQLVEKLRDTYREQTGIASLKISHNNMLGYYIEITAQHAKKMDDVMFVHRQTLANNMRFTTEALRNLESDIINAVGQVHALEMALFDSLATHVKDQAESIALAAQSVATIDVITALAELAVSQHYTRPQVDDSGAFIIKQGRHPVVEHAMRQASSDTTFIANDCDLSPHQRLWLLTGPNMAGKSTFLRQNALIALLAHIGSFVPAQSAYIGVVDRLFSRVGASDDLAKGRSTFMVEMVETATILNQSTAKSLVILDEIGRGTATYDGLSIAWAVAEHLHNQNKCRSLFATHYHELTGLSSQLARMFCYSMKVKEWDNEVIFMHQVVPGAADRSYGIHVAKLAGLPKNVIKRANHILQMLEEMDRGNPHKAMIGELPLFASPAQAPHDVVQVQEHPLVQLVLTTLQEINVDELSPKEALDIVYRLKVQMTNTGY